MKVFSGGKANFFFFFFFDKRRRFLSSGLYKILSANCDKITNYRFLKIWKFLFLENVRRNFRVVIYCILVKKLEIRGNKEVKKNMKILILEIYKEQNLKIYSSNVKI